MNLKKKISIGGGLVLICVSVLALYLGRPIAESIEMNKIFKEFSRYVESGEFSKAQEMLAPDSNCTIKNSNSLICYSDDYTEKVIAPKTKWLATIDYQRKSDHETKYIFQRGYALIDLNQRKTTSIKIP